MNNKILKIIPLIMFCFINLVNSIYADSQNDLENILFNTIWEWHPEGFYKSYDLRIIFLEDSNKIETDHAYGEGYNVLKGTYKILDSQTIKLNYIIYSGYDLEPLGSFKNEEELIRKNGYKQTIAKIEYLKNSLTYSLVIKCDNGIYLRSEEYKVEEGIKGEIDGIEVISMGGKKGTTTENVRIRPKPTINSKYLEFNGGMVGRFPYYPQGYDVVIYARTINKDNIGEWNNYWYYVELDCDTLEMESGWVWMYGEFIKIKE